MSFVNRKKKIFMLRKHSVLHLKQRKSVCWLTKSAASEELVGITGGRVDSVRRIQGYYSILYSTVHCVQRDNTKEYLWIKN